MNLVKEIYDAKTYIVKRNNIPQFSNLFYLII